jgi:hypothetical protein
MCDLHNVKRVREHARAPRACAALLDAMVGTSFRILKQEPFRTSARSEDHEHALRTTSIERGIETCDAYRSGVPAAPDEVVCAGDCP